LKGARNTCQWQTESSLRERGQPVTKLDGVSAEQPGQAHCEVARSTAKTKGKRTDSTRERKGRETLTEKVRKDCKRPRRKAKVQEAHTVSKQASSSPMKTLDLVPLDPCFRFLRYPGQRSHRGCGPTGNKGSTWVRRCSVGAAACRNAWTGPVFSALRSAQRPVTHGISSDLPVSGGDTLEVPPGEVGAMSPQ
jgi:hypothetical protein